MPFDSKGKHHINAQMASRASGPRTPTFGSTAKHDEAIAQQEGGIHESPQDSDNATTFRSSDDGSVSTEDSTGNRTEHPSFGHAVMHLASKHGGGGTHMHIHHDGIDHTTHHLSEGGETEGPHSHATHDDLQQHVGMVFGKGGNEEGSQGKQKPYPVSK